MNQTRDLATSAQIDRHDMSVKAILGMEVCDLHGETVGDVDDLLLADGGKINSLIVSVGSTLGMGGRLVAVPFRGLDVNYSDNTVNIALTADQLEDEPEFEDRDL